MDEWLLRVGSFPRGLAVAVSLLGVVILIGAAIVWHSPLELLVGAAAVVCLSLTYPLAVGSCVPRELRGAIRSIFTHPPLAESVNVKMDRFAARWDGVSGGQRRTEQTRKQVIADATLPVRTSALRRTAPHGRYRHLG